MKKVIRITGKATRGLSLLSVVVCDTMGRRRFGIEKTMHGFSMLKSADDWYDACSLRIRRDGLGDAA